MAIKFRVLLIDDDQRVVKFVSERVSGKPREFDGRSYSVDFYPVHIGVEVANGISKIVDKTFNDLAEACKKPPTLILADFGYVNAEIGKGLRTEALAKKKRKEKMTASDTEGKIFTPKDLARIINDSKSTIAVPLATLLRRNFLDSEAKFYLYSYPSEEFFDAFGPVDLRGKVTELAFRNCEVISVDTRVKFYAQEKFDPFDSQGKSKHDSEFYAHLATNFIEEIVQIEFLNFILNDSTRARYDRLKLYAKILGVAAGVGLAAEALGAQFFKQLEHGNWASAILFGLTGAITLIFLGIGASILIEYFVEGKRRDTKEIPSADERD